MLSGFAAIVLFTRIKLMKLQHRRLIFPLLVLMASLMFAPANCRAQLLPPGDFQGKSLDEWGLDYEQWSIATGLGGQSLSDTVVGVRYLPHQFAGDSASLTIPQGTPLVGSPFFLFGERYDDESEDNPNDPILDTIFEQTTIRTTVDGSVVLEGFASQFPERTYGVTEFSQPIPYANPIPRGPGLNAVAAIFGVGITTIFDMLPVGDHTIRVDVGPNVLGPGGSFTYNITVVPEPASLISVSIGAFGIVGFGGRRSRRNGSLDGR
jgi:hypothetical protein